MLSANSYSKFQFNYERRARNVFTYKRKDLHCLSSIEFTWVGFPNHPTCSLVVESRGRSSTWLSQRHTRAPLAAAIRLMSGHGAQPRSNQVFYVEERKPEYPEKSPRSTGENQQTQVTYDAGPRIKHGTIVARGERFHRCATCAPQLRPSFKLSYFCRSETKFMVEGAIRIP